MERVSELVGSFSSSLSMSMSSHLLLAVFGLTAMQEADNGAFHELWNLVMPLKMLERLCRSMVVGIMHKKWRKQTTIEKRRKRRKTMEKWKKN
ncbi:hypothetical protein ACMD2_10785 [Ananas comosus]|uniref:Uncharacterized protein n=1 Tax=Ananas comosus TaxID=4615 RepID=A0A199VSU2_ANACO|nr:hypothetical protein ACMD2_10785 [Ananas comosus]